MFFSDAYIKPSRAWPGEGILGCELGMGKKYCIPLPKALRDKMELEKPKGLTGLIKNWTKSKTNSKEKSQFENEGVELRGRMSLPQSQLPFSCLKNLFLTCSLI